ncbi:MAG: hypothetical protein H5T98_01990 [Syntrophomonadaceae bacterium]|nr:hypothetical protein [Syntrophomonadaceae bacterium]
MTGTSSSELTHPAINMDIPGTCLENRLASREEAAKKTVNPGLFQAL